MKIKTIILIVASLPAFVASAQVANETYVVDTKESLVTWKGSMEFGPRSAHVGYVKVSKGELIMQRNQLVGGKIDVEMITMADMIHGSDNELIRHLRSPDFFDVLKYPISTFTITRVALADPENRTVTGDLTIKGITHEVTFPVEIEINAGVVNANGKLVIDRTKWDIRYNSGKFYSNLADETISDDIELDVKIVAKGNRVTVAPAGITRAVLEDKNGTIWVATFEGMFRYDGKSFSNVTNSVTQARFFSVLQDRKGNLWFGTIGSGVFRFDGRSFQNFTTRDGLLNNEVGWIYEDKAGDIWFGLNGGASRYDGNSFQNYMIYGDTMIEEKNGKTFPDFTRPPNEVTSIIEDKAGNLWFATRGKTFIYNRKGFTVVANKGKAFINVRTMIEDKKGNVWLGGDGLWRYDGKDFINLTKNFTGYIYEDRKGNVWTSSATGHDWALFRYDEKSLSDLRPAATRISSDHKEIRQGLFGITETRDGSIWVGTSDGAFRYDGKIVTGFK